MASKPGEAPYTLGERLACVGVKFLQYSLAGAACGFAGQVAANLIADLTGAGAGAGQHAIAAPVDTALATALFMGVSSNLRYQAVFGIERAVDGTIASRIPQVRPSLIRVSIEGSSACSWSRTSARWDRRTCSVRTPRRLLRVHGVQAAYVTTIAVRALNNVLGSANYIDVLVWLGVQPS